MEYIKSVPLSRKMHFCKCCKCKITAYHSDPYAHAAPSSKARTLFDAGRSFHRMSVLVKQAELQPAPHVACFSLIFNHCTFGMCNGRYFQEMDQPTWNKTHYADFFGGRVCSKQISSGEYCMALYFIMFFLISHCNNNIAIIIIIIHAYMHRYISDYLIRRNMQQNNFFLLIEQTLVPERQ